MNGTRKRKLIYRLLLFVLPLLILSVAGTGFVLSYSNHRDFNATLNRDYRSMLSASANGIRFYMENAQSGLEALARLLGAAKLDPVEQQIALGAYNLKSTNMMAIRLFSPQKELLASTGWSGGNESPPADSAFQAVLGGHPTVSDVLFTPQHVPYVCMGVPVFHLGQVRAVLWGELNLKAVWTVIKDINIGETGKVYMAGFDGKVVAERDMADVIRASFLVPPEIVAELRKAVSTPFSWVETGDGKKYYSLGVAIPSTQWIIVLRQTDREVYEYLNRNIRLAALLIVSVCLFATLVAWVLVRRFLAPLHELHEQVQRIGNGELDCRIVIESRDEVGELGVAVNQMADSIRTYIEREVENVRELAHARNLATLGAASSKVTHEVGNLLNNIEIILLKLKKEPLSPAVEESIHTLEVEAGRIGRFIENLLQFAKKPHLRLQTISLEVVIEEIIAIYGPEAERRGIRIERDWPPDLPPVSLDASLMYQVLNNLLKNSLETPSAPTRIHIGGTVEAHWLRVTIQDDGPGIEPQILDRIFEPFFSTKPHKGTGIGLAICRTILEAHRGTIHCETKPGEYTAFILRLPLQ